MKTTLDISESLLEKIKELARQEKLTLRALVEEGLNRVINDRKARKKLTLRDASFQGNDIQAEFEGASWQKFVQPLMKDMVNDRSRHIHSVLCSLKRLSFL